MPDGADRGGDPGDLPASRPGAAGPPPCFGSAPVVAGFASGGLGRPAVPAFAAVPVLAAVVGLPAALVLAVVLGLRPAAGFLAVLALAPAPAFGPAFAALVLAVVLGLRPAAGFLAVLALAPAPAFGPVLGLVAAVALPAGLAFPPMRAVAVGLVLVAAAVAFALAGLARPAAVDLALAVDGFLAPAGLAFRVFSTETSGMAVRIADTTVFKALAALVTALVAVTITVMATDSVLGEDVTFVTALKTLAAADEIFLGAAGDTLANGAASLFVSARTLAVAVAALDLVAAAVLRLAVLRLAVVPAVLRLAVVLRFDVVAAVLRLGVARSPAAALAEVLRADVLLVRPAAVVRPAVARLADSVATDLPPVTISYGDIYSTVGDYLHTTCFVSVPLRRK